MGLSLRGMSILIFLLDKNKSKVISVEKIFLEKRLRHFGLNYSDSNHTSMLKSKTYYSFLQNPQGLKVV